ncbi:hypothetical protein VNO80_06192 [Phaseolus coccineus]|uniref:TIR domain-containing protein n=1 Tax=Phaseolus coccineus TaxID=3886 RepID=A0AAN9NLN6_PHACN
MTEIEEKLQQKKVLLVLDDVGDKDQLEKLAGGCQWFGPDYAKGLPLALKVIGSDLATLHEESLEDWKMAMEEYEKTPNKKIQDVLKISYDNLNHNAKQIFLFISFRGEDTRYTFIGHLRRELGRRRIKSFNDDKNMRIGESFSPALSKAIEESKIFIVVFSENYASSTRCLDELVRIIERSKMKEKKQLVYPVFYHVDPSDIRHERNSFGKHMKAHENEIGKESQRMQDWRSALSQAVDFPGRHITTGYV